MGPIQHATCPCPCPAVSCVVEAGASLPAALADFESDLGVTQAPAFAPFTVIFGTEIPGGGYPDPGALVEIKVQKFKDINGRRYYGAAQTSTIHEVLGSGVAIDWQFEDGLGTPDCDGFIISQSYNGSPFEVIWLELPFTYGWIDTTGDYTAAPFPDTSLIAAGQVVLWESQVNGYEAEAIAGQELTVIDAQLNGYPALRGGATQYAQSTGAIPAAVATMVAVLKLNSVAGAMTFFSWHSSGLNLSITPGDWTFSGAGASGGAPSDASAVVLVWVLNGASSYLAIDGVTVATGTAALGFNIVSMYGNADWFACTVWDSVLSAPDIATAIAAKEAKYAL